MRAFPTLLFRIVTPQLVPPSQESCVSRQQCRFISNGGRHDEVVGGIAAQIFQFAGDDCNVSSEWQLAYTGIENQFLHFGSRIDGAKPSICNQHAISQKLMALIAKVPSANASVARRGPSRL